MLELNRNSGRLAIPNDLSRGARLGGGHVIFSPGGTRTRSCKPRAESASPHIEDETLAAREAI